MRRANKLNFLALLVAFVVSGCASTPEEETTMSDAATVPETSADTMEGRADTQTYADGSSGKASASDMSSGSMAGDESLRDTKVFYFDYDMAVVKPAGFESLKAHAKFLASNPGATIRLEGHCDERGTREYNIALGERRGNAIAKFLRVNGVSSKQIEVISYGEEKPAAFGHDESSLALNRRAEIRYVTN